MVFLEDFELQTGTWCVLLQVVEVVRGLCYAFQMVIGTIFIHWSRVNQRAW